MVDLLKLTFNILSGVVTVCSQTLSMIFFLGKLRTHWFMNTPPHPPTILPPELNGLFRWNVFFLFLCSLNLVGYNLLMDPIFATV